MIRVLAFFVVAGLPAAAWAQSLLDGDSRSPIDPPERPAIEKHDHVRIKVLEQDLGTFVQFQPSGADAAVKPGFSLMAEIIDVRPNGTLVIQAMGRRMLNGDEVAFRVTGEVSPQAIVDGCIRSDDIANLDLTSTESGSTGESGSCWLGRMLSKLWPF